MEKTKNIYADENAISVVAYLVVLITVFGLYFQQQWLLYFLVTDFFIRATGIFESPLYRIGKAVSEFLYFDKRPVFAAPKRFAASLGLIMSMLIAFFYTSQTGIFLGIILILLASLESVFHVCIGCYIYNYAVLPVLRKFDQRKKLKI